MTKKDEGGKANARTDKGEEEEGKDEKEEWLSFLEKKGNGAEAGESGELQPSAYCVDPPQH